jgi:putative Mg2+ transporter-C (MgtC) family protein
MGSALFVVISELAVATYLGVDGLNPLQMAAQIVVGVGFLGTGIIFSQNAEQKSMGLTTATGLWVAAGIGMATGFGFFKIGLIATMLTLFIFTVLWLIEERFKKTSLVNESSSEK